MDWVKKTLGTAKEVGNQEKVRFYEGLLKAVKIDVHDVKRESNQWIREMNALELQTPISEISGLSATEDGESDQNNGVEASETKSPPPWPSNNQDTSAHIKAEASTTTNPHPSQISNRPQGSSNTPQSHKSTFYRNLHNHSTQALLPLRRIRERLKRRWIHAHSLRSVGSNRRPGKSRDFPGKSTTGLRLRQQSRIRRRSRD